MDENGVAIVATMPYVGFEYDIKFQDRTGRWQGVGAFTCVSLPSPSYACPKALMQIIPDSLRDDFKDGDRSGNVDSTSHEPTYGEGVDCAKRSPAYCLEQ